MKRQFLKLCQDQKDGRKGHFRRILQSFYMTTWILFYARDSQQAFHYIYDGNIESRRHSYDNVSNVSGHVCLLDCDTFVELGVLLLQVLETSVRVLSRINIDAPFFDDFMCIIRS